MSNLAENRTLTQYTTYTIMANGACGEPKPAGAYKLFTNSNATAPHANPTPVRAWLRNTTNVTTAAPPTETREGSLDSGSEPRVRQQNGVDRGHAGGRSEEPFLLSMLTPPPPPSSPSPAYHRGLFLLLLVPPSRCRAARGSSVHGSLCGPPPSTTATVR